MSADGHLQNKYTVTRNDGANDDPASKHYDGCRVFVLDLGHDPHARTAAMAYADACEPTHPTLAADLRTIVGNIRILFGPGKS